MGCVCAGRGVLWVRLWWHNCGTTFEISLLSLKPPGPQELAHTRQTSSADEACT